MNYEEQFRQIGESISKLAKEGADEARISAAYLLAKETFAAIGVDTDKAMKALDNVEISMHCWQGDDVGGFEKSATELSGGIMTTGNYPGKAATIEQLWGDLEKAMSLIPGKQKVNVHASYISSTDKPDRNAIEPSNYTGWVDWAKRNGIGLDFNATYFSHPLSASGFTLSSADDAVREFWIEHGKRSRIVGEYFGRELGKTCVVNQWVPDGYKDNPIDKKAPRDRLAAAYDRVFEQKFDTRYIKDAVESKVFGIGSEAYVPGSHEFYMGYALSRKNAMVTLDRA